MRISAKLTATFAAASALALSACGSDESDGAQADGDAAVAAGEYQIDEESGETSMWINGPDGAVSMRTGAEVPIDLPAGFTLIGGATVTNNITINQAGEKGALVTFTSDKRPQEIADFYRKQAQAAGIAIQIETNINGGAMLGGEDAASGTTFSITAYPGEEGTTGQLTIGQDLN